MSSEVQCWQYGYVDYRMKFRNSMTEDTKRACDNWRCGWKGYLGEVLTAPDPFNEGIELEACPKCRQQTTRTCCDEPDCWEPPSMGTPTDKGYRNTCSKHYPFPRSPD